PVKAFPAVRIALARNGLCEVAHVNVLVLACQVACSSVDGREPHASSHNGLAMLALFHVSCNSSLHFALLHSAVEHPKQQCDTPCLGRKRELCVCNFAHACTPICVVSVSIY